ncbi:MAG: hypothetical protein K2Q18_12465, partial [Bdellovibrionales bacterium]|nr:hypothetical protein [Bdellovibrionales bacterium]
MSLQIDQNLNSVMETLLSPKISSMNELKLKRSQPKGLPMFCKTLTLVICLSTCSLAFAAKTGAGSGGGGYQYKDTAYPNMKEAQSNLLRRLSVTTDEELNQVTSKLGLESASKEKLAKIINSVKYAPLENRTIGVDGFEQPKDMDYSIDGQYVLALQPLFESINKKSLSEDEKNILERKIIHEASHLFNIGIENDDESFNFSKEVISLLSNHYPVCGMQGTIEERLGNCKPIERFNNRLGIDPELGPIVNYIYKYRPIVIHDSRSLFGFLTLQAKF